MLKQAKAWRRANQKGSILLLVVLMVMVLFTLTSISLDVIHHSTKVSSRNVQKTQAKLTAERVLTEFIEGFKEGKTHEGVTGDAIFAELQELATGKSAANPCIIDVTMKDSSGVVQSDFDQTYGKTELHLYSTSTGGFVVESICTYSSQTQTASVVFEGTVINPYVPSNTIESQSGMLTGYSQLSQGVDGSLYIENGTGEDHYKKLSRKDYHAHIYSEFNIRVDDTFEVFDMLNKTKVNAFNVKDGNPFWQAPTIQVDGYFTTYNSVHNISTNCGRIDENGNCPGATGYDPDKPGNYDGFIRVEKKIIIPDPKAMTFGDASAANKNIDIYARGMVIGEFPTCTIDGHNFQTELDSLVGTDPSDPNDGIYPEGLDNAQNGKFEMNGNLYLYKGANLDYQDGSLVLNKNCPIEMVVNGDIFIEGNIYLIGGSNHTIKCKNFYCSPTTKIFVSESDTGYFTVTGGAFVQNGTTSRPSTGITATGGTISSNIDYTQKRNQFPTQGYDPQTGNNSATRTKLKDVYKEASANDIFTMDLEGTDPTLVGAAQGISHKYADAMSRSFTLDGIGKSCRVTSATMFKPATWISGYHPAKNAADEIPVVTYNTADSLDDGNCDKYYDIWGSVMLNQDQARGGMSGAFANCKMVGYIVRLVDEDIVIAMPTGDNGARFRIDRSQYDDTKKPFVYYMYYDPSDPEKCLYYSGTTSDTISKSDGTLISMTAGGSSTYTDGKAKGTINHGQAGSGSDKANVIVGDYTAIGKADVKENFRCYDFNNSPSENYIMFLVPNDVQFRYFNDGAGVKSQGLIYALNSRIDMEVATGESQFVGQMKGYQINFHGDNKNNTVDCPMADGSLLGYVAAKNANVSVVKLQYYQY